MNRKTSRHDERIHMHSRRRDSQQRAYVRARADWAAHYAANATLQLHLR